MVIIGLYGSIGSGKDTVASLLVNKYNFVQLSFGKRLKETVDTLFNWQYNLISGDTMESREWREQKDDLWSQLLRTDITTRTC